MAKQPVSKRKKTIPDKYTLYEQAVQSPEEHIHWFYHIFQDLFGRRPTRLREDFCGTFLISRHWVDADPKNTAVVLDLDPEPLAYGLKRIKPGNERRIRVLQKNVCSVTRPAPDLIAACNFSFCIFKKREELLDYFKKCYRSLPKGRRGGTLVLELAGGPGMIQPMRERRRVHEKDYSFTYTWHQKSFDPISHDGLFSIHFDLDDGPRLKDAFVYDWRLWTIPELRDALTEAGFEQTAVYWETEHQGEATGEFVRSERGDNAFAWIAYVVGIRKG